MQLDASKIALLVLVVAVVVLITWAEIRSRRRGK
jgi:hypothetical protein